MSVVRDLKLADEGAGDLVIENGDLALVADEPAVRQAINIGLRFYQGEWFLDETAGIPWFERVFIKGANYNEVRQWIRLTILAVPDVRDVTSTTFAYARATRELSVNFIVTTTSGATVASQGVSVP